MSSTCPQCAQEFQQPPSDARRGVRFCSRTCRVAAKPREAVKAKARTREKQWRQENLARVRATRARYKRNHATAYNAQKQAWRQRNPEKERHIKWASALRRQYGITPEQYAKLLALQENVCAVCGKPPREGRRLDVDHDHKTGQVRGLLHGYPCNRFLVGKHTRATAQAVARYLSSDVDGRTL